ncbi:MAG: ElyC/SanA/YdcF family protein [Pseudomonadota bacterium]
MPLIETEEVSHADAIVLMNGNLSTRTYAAKSLCDRTGAPIFIVRLADTEEVSLGVIPNISEASVQLLHRLGVGDSSVHLLDTPYWIAGTWSEALAVRDFLDSKPVRNICIVTDLYHTRRACWTFRQVLGSKYRITAYSTAFSRATRTEWWRSEYGLVQVAVEFLKFAHYRWSFFRGRRPKQLNDLPPAREIRSKIVSGEF